MAKKTFEAQLAHTIEHRPLIAREFHPLFDHLINLARDSHRNAQDPSRGADARHMFAKRWGRELAQARKMATKYPVV